MVNLIDIKVFMAKFTVTLKGFGSANCQFNVLWLI